ncbi:hypothetical protein [Castellaniella defragrans]|uniref:hypothetical protein n=1 Tax=Castellaniella defragrans TaxID=75697 RepID=UPI002B001D98|nr:hypothetical protein [Castellaniella defragrans]
MPANTSSSTLYRIDECSDLMADACVCNEQGEFIFLSIWARDTAIQQFARLTLGRDEDGLDQFHLINDHGSSIPVMVGAVDRLEKRLTRAYRRTLFGSMTNLWLFDRRCIQPEKSTASALALLPRSANDPTARLWRLVKDTCPLPLLEHWQAPVLALLRDPGNAGKALPMVLGPLQGFHLTLDVPLLTLALGDLIRQDVLTAYPAPLSAATNRPLEAVA